jgi:dihydrofolate reductase
VGKVFVDMTMSLDGYVAGPNDGPALPLGENGERLHAWLYNLASWRERHGIAGGTADRDAEILDEAFRNLGAVVLGKRMYDLAGGWGENPPFHVPVLVLTHTPQETIVKEGGTTFIFVTEGIEHALQQARAAAGDRDISIAGGANTVQQFVNAGLVDEIQIHLAPILLGGGVRLFDHLDTAQIALERTRVIDAPRVTHMRFRIMKGSID